MMRRTLVSALAAGAIASSAMAIDLVPIPKVVNALDGTTQVGMAPTSITPDGAYVGGIGGLGFGTTGVDTGFVYNTSSGTVAQPVAGGYQDSVNGIGYRYPTGGGVELVIGGANGGWQSMNASTDGGTTWIKRRRTSTHAYGGGSNTVAGSGGATIYATFQTPSSGTPTLYVDAWNDGGWASAPDSKGTSTESNINGVSSTGLAVGRRKVSGVYNNYVLEFQADGGLNAVFTPGLDGTNVGSLWDIADNGTYAGGMSPVTDGRPGEFAYVRNMSTAALTELPTLGGASLGGTNSIVYGMAPNGEWAVGMDHTTGVELAVLWDLRDINNPSIINLTQFAADNGVLGAFTGNLRRAYAMGINGAGDPVITGVGYAGSLEASGWTGFVMTVPEPSSMLFLALGGLALIRRR